MHETISFRIAGEADIPLIQELSSLIWREHYPGIITHGQIDYMLRKMYAADVIRDEILHKVYRYILVIREKDAVGFIAYRFGEPDRAVMISKLYLLPSLHGKGIGRKMLQHVKDNTVISGLKRITLFVNKNNSKAIAAYERFGFKKVEAIVTDIGGGFVMDDYRMELQL